MSDPNNQQQDAPATQAPTSRWAKGQLASNNALSSANNTNTAGSNPMPGANNNLFGGGGGGAGLGLGLGSSTPLIGGGGRGGLGLGLGLATPSMNASSWLGNGAASNTAGGSATPNVSSLMGGATGAGLGGSSTPSVNTLFGGGLGLGATPLVGGTQVGMGLFGATPTIPTGGGLGMATPSGFGGLGMQTPMTSTGLGGATPMMGGTGLGLGLGGGVGGATGGLASAASTANTLTAKAQQLEREYDERNRYLTDEDLDELMPAVGYSIVAVPSTYVPIESDRPNFYELAVKSLETMGLGISAGVNATAEAVGATYEVPEEMGEGLPNLTERDVASGAFEILLKYHKVDDADIPSGDVAKYVTMKQLLCVKNGDTRQRRAGMKTLCEKADLLGLDTVFTSLFDNLYARCEMDAQERHYLVKLVERLISRYADRVAPYGQKIVFYFESLLTDADSIMRDDGREVLALLASTIGIRNMYEILKRDIDNEDDRIRRHTAKVIAVIAHAVGPEEVMRIVRPVSSARSAVSRHTIVKAIDEMTVTLGFRISKVLDSLGRIFEALLRDPDHRVKTDAALALSKVCDVVAPTGMSAFTTVLQIVREQCHQTTGKGKMLAAFLKALGSLVPLMAPEDAKRTCMDILPNLINLFSTPDDDLRRIVLRVVRQCLTPEGISAEYLRQYFVGPFSDHFWTTKVATEDRQTRQLLIATTVEVGKKAGGSEILTRLIPLMVEDAQELLMDRYPQLQELALEAVREVVVQCGTLDLSTNLVERLLENSLRAFLRDIEGTNRTVLRSFAAVINSLKHTIGDYLEKLMPEIDLRVDNQKNEAIRAQACDLLGMVAATIYRDGEGLQEMRRLTRNLTDRIQNEERALPLGAALRALVFISRVIGCEKLEPPPAELIGILRPIIRNRDSVVKQYVVEMIEEIALMYQHFSRFSPNHPSRPPTTLMNQTLLAELVDISTHDLLPLLDSDRKATKRACTRAFAVLTRVTTGFIRVTLALVENFTQERRDVRITTAVALSALAEKCQPFTVIPFLINEYEKCEMTEVAKTVQHAVLKALRFIFEEIGPLGKDYIYPLVPLIERAVTEQCLQVRRMAMELIRAVLFVMVDQTASGGATIHFLSLVHPNIVELLSGKKEKISEDRLKLISATVQVYEVARLVVGSQIIFQYRFSNIDRRTIAELLIIAIRVKLVTLPINTKLHGNNTTNEANDDEEENMPRRPSRYGSPLSVSGTKRVRGSIISSSLPLLLLSSSSSQGSVPSAPQSA